MLQPFQSMAMLLCDMHHSSDKGELCEQLTAVWAVDLQCLQAALRLLHAPTAEKWLSFPMQHNRTWMPLVGCCNHRS